jgi:ABC-type multidrug transport system permease subunit
MRMPPRTPSSGSVRVRRMSARVLVILLLLGAVGFLAYSLAAVIALVVAEMQGGHAEHIVSSIFVVPMLAIITTLDGLTIVLIMLLVRWWRLLQR